MDFRGMTIVGPGTPSPCDLDAGAAVSNLWRLEPGRLRSGFPRESVFHR
jgi:hypothetical protein